MKLIEVFQDPKIANPVYLLYCRYEGYGGRMTETPIAVSGEISKLNRYMESLPPNTNQEDSADTRYFIKKQPISFLK